MSDELPIQTPAKPTFSTPSLTTAQSRQSTRCRSIRARATNVSPIVRAVLSRLLGATAVIIYDALHYLNVMKQRGEAPLL